MIKIFIPIKHNSQRVSRKNFRLLEGEPLYKRQILKFIKSNFFNIYIDTDSDEIIEDIKSDNRLNSFKNLNVYKRPENLTGDKVAVNDLINNFFKNIDINENEFIAQIHVTSPFLESLTVKNAFELTKSEDIDSIVGSNIIQSRLWRKEKYGMCPVNHNPMKLEQTQDLPKYYEENSSLYIFNKRNFNKYDNRIGLKPFFYEIKFPENIDIDTEEDWNMIKIMNGI